MNGLSIWWTLKSEKQNSHPKREVPLLLGLPLRPVVLAEVSVQNTMLTSLPYKLMSSLYRQMTSFPYNLMFTLYRLLSFPYKMMMSLPYRVTMSLP